ncbi:polysaccharide ABC transporter ATP-binding protein [Dictyobacter alpinus]|uniref:Polysaccharide ABC transporter ATP-binding protein n=1 Tax=Dictyobacter alpinus TaxID=2014873 RepID=A0A402BE25_9CHLR|nr:ABC transporter permease subunit [Dictyobacter alpinus]GCE29556.1 polysaccharide ABC transporter ATP-binding protein [Dictyobacter alpinus]
MAEKIAVTLVPGRQRNTSISAPKGAASKPPASPRRVKNAPYFWRTLWRERWVYLLFLPGFLYFLAFNYIPLLGNVIAFQEFSPYLGIFRSPWIGFANFQRLFTDPMIGSVIQNTLLISFLQIVFAFPIGIVLSLMLNALVSERFKRFVQSVVYLPHFIGWVIIISVWQQIFGGDGFLNHFITGLGGQPVNLMSNSLLFRPMLVLQVIWKETGWSTVLFMAALTSIDPTLYEASAVDGASRWHRLWHVTLPGIRGVIILLFILRIGSILSTGFEQIFLQRGAVGLNMSEVIDTFVYDRGLVNGDWSFAATVGLIKLIVGALLIFTANSVAKKMGEEGLY